MNAESPDAKWYVVCSRCGAKGFFSGEQKVRCPRCQKLLESTEKLIPPWSQTKTIRAAVVDHEDANS